MSAALINSDDPLEPTLQSILDQKTLRWIFVGGKGGVGKTTTSCSLAIQLAKVRRSVLLISTDPAHNLSDAFAQKFGKEARLIDGFTNLSAMEIDPNGSIQELIGQNDEGSEGIGGMGGMMQDLAFAIPGIDEAMSFAEVLKQVKSLSYETIIFDTAPTGHTLRFLQFPTVLEKALAKVSQLSTQFGPMLNGILGAQGGLPNGANLNEMMEKLEGLRETISEVNTQFKDEQMTTFVCVCIPEFLSLYETERMIQELANYGIDTHCIVVNQLLFPKQGSDCEQCNARRKMQKKYLEQIEELYDEFNVVKMPLLVEEVRGKERLEKFSEMLIHPLLDGGKATKYLHVPRSRTTLRAQSRLNAAQIILDAYRTGNQQGPVILPFVKISNNHALIPTFLRNTIIKALFLQLLYNSTMATAVKRQKLSSTRVRQAQPATRKSGRLDTFARVTKVVTTTKSVIDKNDSVDVATLTSLGPTPTSPKKRKQVTEVEVDDEDCEATEESASLLSAALSNNTERDIKLLPPRHSSALKVPCTPRKALLHPPSAETPTKGATSLLNKLQLTKPLTSPKNIGTAPGTSLSLDSSTPQPKKFADLLPIELLDLINLHTSFLTALSLFYAHHGTSSPADLRQLYPDVSRVWGKRRVTLEDIRRTLGVMNMENKKCGREDPSMRLSLSDYGDGKYCVEMGAESECLSIFGQPLNETLLNGRFQDSLKSLWRASEGTVEPLKFIQSLPMEPITICESLAKLSSIKTTGQRRLEELKADLNKKKEVAEEKKLEKEKEKEQEKNGSRPTLLERLRAKQLEKSNLPPPPSKQELDRKAALQRIEEVAAILGVLSTSSSIGQQRISFTIPTVVGKLQDSFKMPISRSEAENCIRLLASEVAPAWAKMAKMGKVNCLVVMRDHRPSEEDLREKIKLISS
ncbi:hypothetical protein B7463_g4006, partial [Scytalidium lignicola]